MNAKTNAELLAEIRPFSIQIPRSVWNALNAALCAGNTAINFSRPEIAAAHPDWVRDLEIARNLMLQFSVKEGI